MLTFVHGRWRRRVALLAMGALDDAEERAATRRPPARLRRLRARTLAELARVAGPRWPAIRSRRPRRRCRSRRSMARVRARLRQPVARAARAGPRVSLAAAPIAAAAVAVAVHRAWCSRPRSGAVRRTAVRPESAARGSCSPRSAAAAWSATLAREQAARYLTEAQDVLVTVAAAPPPCPRTRGDGRDRGRGADAAATSCARRALRGGRRRRDEVAARSRCWTTWRRCCARWRR